MPDLQTSFIPKQMAATMPTAPATRRKPANFLMIIAVLIFVAGLFASGGVYVYKLYLEKANDALAAELEQTKPDESGIDALKRYNARADTATKLLANHLTLVPLFNLLGMTTLANVRLTSFGFQVNAAGDANSLLIQLHGQAKNYEAIALQSDALNATGAIKNAVFSGLRYDPTSKLISFDVSAIVDPKYLSYAASVVPAQAAAPATAPAPTVPAPAQASAPVQTAPTQAQTQPAKTQTSGTSRSSSGSSGSGAPALPPPPPTLPSGPGS